jgi:hypothetical protein
MLHKGKTFRTKDRRCYALIRSTPSGNQEVCVVINGKLERPETDAHGNLVWPQSAHVPHNLKILARHALACKIRVDRRILPC